MAITGHATGHPIYFDGEVWRYVDTWAVVNHERACSHCGQACAIVAIAARSVSVDACIAPIVDALNEAGVATKASCCGHGRRPSVIALADGRELIIVPDWETARKVDALFPQSIYRSQVTPP